MYVNTQTIITAGAVLTALAAIVGLAYKLFKWIEHQKEQDKEITRIETKFDAALKEVQAQHTQDNAGIQEEQTLVVYGLLACLKGLAEQGCDGPVSEAIAKIEKHINQKAHKQL